MSPFKKCHELGKNLVVLGTPSSGWKVFAAFRKEPSLPLPARGERLGRDASLDCKWLKWLKPGPGRYSKSIKKHQQNKTLRHIETPPSCPKIRTNQGR